MIDRIKIMFKDGFFHILGSSFINKCIAFVTNILIVRFLTKHDYGVFTSAFNVFYIVFLFSGLGITSGILYFCSKNISRDEKTSYYNFSLKFGLFSELVLSIILLLYGLLADVGIEESRYYIIGLSLLPFAAFYFDYYSIILRAEKDNKKYALFLNLNSVFYAVFGVAGALLGGIWGTIIGRYVAYLISDLLGARFCRQYKSNWNTLLGKTDQSDLIRYSVKAGITSALNVILYRIDIYVITIVIADASILASYKVGTALPENVIFIPQCIMVYFLPVFIQNLADIGWIKRKTKEIYLFVGAVSLAIGVVMIVFAPLIIRIIWGEAYLDAVPCLRILSVSFIVLSTFRMTSTNILLALKRTGYTMFVSIISGLVNIILDVVMTIRYGSIGAAYATLIVTVFAAFLSFPYTLYIIYKTEKYE